MKVVLTLTLFGVILLCGCGDDDPVIPGSGTNPVDRQLKVNVYQVKNKEISNLEGVLLDLYNSRYEFQNRQDIFNTGYTDSLGEKSFNNLGTGMYYIVASDSGAEKTDSVNIPASAVVSFLSIVYY